VAKKDSYEKLRKKENEYFLSHFSKKYSSDLKQYAIDEVFKTSRYLFTHRIGKQQFAYCTHCKREYKTEKLKHNMQYECPGCKSNCKVKSSGMGRKTMIDEAYFVYFEKSEVDPKVIIARGIHAVRDYRYDYKKVQTKYADKTLYVFEIGNSKMMKRYVYYSTWQGKNEMYSGELEKCKNVHSFYKTWFLSHPNSVVDCSVQSIRTAVEGTPFQYSTWENYLYDDMVKFFDLYSKYPCIEYITKLGFPNLVEAKLLGNNTYSSINWNGKSIDKVFRLDKKQLNELKNLKTEVDPLFLRLYQMAKKDSSNLSHHDIERIASKYVYYFQDLQKVHKYSTLRKINSYISKQRLEQSKHFFSDVNVLTSWKDYIADCITLEMNLKDERILYPKDLFTAHQESISRVKTEENKFLDKKIAARLNGLQKYCFECNGLIIRPAKSTREMIDEGKALTICVGNYGNGYITKYASGKTNILFIRNSSEPDKPYYCVELSNNNVILQVQGKSHKAPDKNVSEFIKVYTSQVLEKKQPKTKVAIPA
jgi:hypothetical protein